MIMKKLKIIFGGMVTGLLNGLLGAGGGMAAVPVLKTELEPKLAHANSVCIILPICVISAINYLTDGRVAVYDVFPYLIWGLIGAAAGTLLLQKIKPVLLKKIFAAVMLWAGLRMIFR